MKASLNIAKKIADIARRNPGKEKEIADNLVGELSNKNLTYLLPSVVKNLEEIENARIKEDTVLAQVSHPHLLSEAQIREIAGAPQTARVKIIVDEELLGGSIIRYRGKETDLSAEAQVQRLNRSFK